ncbi:unnamed protein product [Albugo candida]|uniref:Secreted protein n=1 Tax=Albugo candida TaxID=65357 RepID=A0A024FW06_9STRA|nr:unnamed protein product [Albugo candida]|eukprot:CCI11310.1 unnamed protein product [Albugo candida]
MGCQSMIWCVFLLDSAQQLRNGYCRSYTCAFLLPVAPNISDSLYGPFSCMAQFLPQETSSYINLIRSQKLSFLCTRFFMKPANKSQLHMSACTQCSAAVIFSLKLRGKMHI